MTYKEFSSRDYVLFPSAVWKRCYDELSKMTLEEYDRMHEEVEKHKEELFQKQREDWERRRKEELKQQNRNSLIKLGETVGICAFGVFLGFIGENAGPWFWWLMIFVDAGLIAAMLAD